ncbi:MAG: hypothetical protein LBQ10_12050 [Desulfovibrio sp.]|jgi:hypothetical protein|nr:hypothetical protein [Desulfovibrio sp.]
MRWYSGTDDGLDDDSLLFALELMRHDRRERIVFFDRAEPFEPAEWLAWCKGENKIFTMVFRNDGTPVAAVWFTDGTRTGRQVFSHFCGFGTAGFAELVRAGKSLLGKIAENTSIRQFIGVTPACYRHALKLAYSLGYERLVCLRGAVQVHGKERDAILTVCGPEEQREPDLRKNQLG